MDEKIEERKIKGVKIIHLINRGDDRGILTEVFRNSWDLMSHSIRQVYTVTDPVRGTIRAYHKHEELWDLFSIINGSSKFSLIDDRKDSETYNQQDTIVLSTRMPCLLVVPPKIFHGWESLEDNTILLSIASHEYNREKPDELRKPYNFIGGKEWGIQPR